MRQATDCVVQSFSFRSYQLVSGGKFRGVGRTDKYCFFDSLGVLKGDKELREARKKSGLYKFFFVLVDKNPADYTQALTKEIDGLSRKEEGISVI